MTSPNTILYTAEATVEGRREGRARSSDGRFEVDLDIPAGMNRIGRFKFASSQHLRLGVGSNRLSKPTRRCVLDQTDHLVMA